MKRFELNTYEDGHCVEAVYDPDPDRTHYLVWGRTSNSRDLIMMTKYKSRATCLCRRLRKAYVAGKAKGLHEAGKNN